MARNMAVICRYFALFVSLNNTTGRLDNSGGQKPIKISISMTPHYYYSGFSVAFPALM